MQTKELLNQLEVYLREKGWDFADRRSAGLDGLEVRGNGDPIILDNPNEFIIVTYNKNPRGPRFEATKIPYADPECFPKIAEFLKLGSEKTKCQQESKAKTS